MGQNKDKVVLRFITRAQSKLIGSTVHKCKVYIAVGLSLTLRLIKLLVPYGTKYLYSK